MPACANVCVMCVREGVRGEAGEWSVISEANALGFHVFQNARFIGLHVFLPVPRLVRASLLILFL
jgi:hypothetical protein